MSVATAPLLQGTPLEEQVALELEAVDEGVKRYWRLVREAIERREAAGLKPFERLEVHWFEVLSAVIQDERLACKRGEQGSFRAVYGPVLLAVEADKLAVITMHTALNQCLARGGSVKLTSLATTLGASVVAEVGMCRLRRESREQYNVLTRRFRNLNAARVNWWARKHLKGYSTRREVYLQVGTILLKLLIEHASAGDYMEEKFDPAFEERLVWARRRSVAFVGMTKRALALVEEGHRARQVMRPRYLPMLVTPYAWTADEQGRLLVEGGYTRIRTPFVSKPTQAQKRALATADLSRVFDGLNAVGAAAWRPQRQVAEVQKVLYARGGGLLEIPRAEPRPHPAHPAGYDPDAPPGQRWAAVEPAAKKLYKREANAAIVENIRGAGARENFLHKIAIAERFMYRTMYFPHQLCFRGRGYPIPLYLNHQGDDVCRGLLEFAEAKPCVGDGPHWLRVDTANSWGHNKLPFEQRVAWVEDNMREIRATAKDPLGVDWWHQADEPWQFLSCCLALTDPHVAAHHPVKMDGTCNGLQHYSAMGRDAVGGAAVNLLPTDAPADLYKRVAEVTERLVAADAAAGDPLARTLLPYIDRALVKRPVMTKVYGVTFMGAKAQLAQVLAERGLRRDTLADASKYLARVVLDAVGQVCQAATAIMAWLQRCAELIVEQNRLVAWTTPLGFPVVQPYRTWGKSRVRTVMGNLHFLVQRENARVAKADHINGVAANFNHSVDGSHMLMTATECRARSITFAAVHDQDWTHAVSCGPMLKVNAEQFVALHSKPLLQDLLMQWRFQHPDVEFPEPPPQGDLDLRQVLNAPYFFS